MDPESHRQISIPFKPKCISLLNVEKKCVLLLYYSTCAIVSRSLDKLLSCVSRLIFVDLELIEVLLDISLREVLSSSDLK